MTNSFYVQANGGYHVNLTRDTINVQQRNGGCHIEINEGKKPIGNYGVTIGTNFEKKGTHFGTEAKLGNALGAKVEAGHTFQLNKKTGFDVSANAKIYGQPHANYTDAKAAAKGQLIYEPSKRVKLGLGVETGVHSKIKINKAISQNVDVNVNDINMGNINVDDLEQAINAIKEQNNLLQDMMGNMNSNTQKQTGSAATNNEYGMTITSKSRPVLSKRKFFATPTVSAEVKLSKPEKENGWSFVLDSSLYQGNAGIRYTF